MFQVVEHDRMRKQGAASDVEAAGSNDNAIKLISAVQHPDNAESDCNTPAESIEELCDSVAKRLFLLKLCPPVKASSVPMTSRCLLFLRTSCCSPDLIVSLLMSKSIYRQ